MGREIGEEGLFSVALVWGAKFCRRRNLGGNGISFDMSVVIGDGFMQRGPRRC